MSDTIAREEVATKLHEMANELFGERGPLRLFSDHLAAAALFIRADAAALTRLRADLAAAQEREQRMREALEVILPLAKGYVAYNRVGSNQRYIEAAEAALGEPQ